MNNKHPFSRQFFGFFKASLISQLKSPSAIVFGFAFPLAFITIFGLISNGSGSKINVGIVQNDQVQTAQIKDSLDKTGIFSIKEDSKDKLIQLIEKPGADTSNEIGGIIEVTSQGNITFYQNNSRPQDVATINQVISTLSDKIALQQNGIKSAFKIQTQSVSSREVKYIDFALPGLLGFSLLSAGISGTSFSFLTLKRTNALKRIFAAPASSAAFITGQAFARVAFSIAQNATLLLVAIFAFKYSPANGLSSILQMILILFIGILTFLGMGYIVAGVSKTDEQVAPFTQLLTLPQILLAGTFFSITGFPDWVQAISKSLPLYNFNEALRLISVNGYNLWDTVVLQQIMFLSIWLVVIYFIASRVFRIK